MLRNASITLGRPLGAALAFTGLLLLGFAAVGVSWADLSAATAERDAKADLLERSVSASRRAVLQPGGAAPADPFVSGETVTLAAAKLDADLRTLAQSCGLSLRSSRAEAKPDEPGAVGAGGSRIEDQAIVEGPNEALQALLVRLETGAPVVLVDALAIEPAEVDQAMVTDPQAPKLRMTLTLVAYWRPGRQGPVAVQ